MLAVLLSPAIALAAPAPAPTPAPAPASTPVPATATAPAPAAAPAKPAPKKAEVYKWTDDKGVIHYTDKPPTDNAKPATLPPLQTYKRGTLPDLNKFAAPAPAKPEAARGAQIQIVTPASEETFRSDRAISVAVIVSPAPDPSQKLVYMLDGQAIGSPTSETSYALTEVDRGEHSVSVALVDASGQELSRSAPVTFFMKPPGGKR